MPVQTEHRFPPDLSVLDAAGSRVNLAGLRGQARAVAAYFMRAGTGPACIHRARALARRTCPPTACSRPWWYPARRRTPPGSDASSATGSPSCPPLAPRAHLAAGLHRTPLLQHSGIMLVDSAGVVRDRPATALPTGSFGGPTLQAAIDRL